jgi:hypothetical protein
MSDALDTITKTVPTLYYDLIARFVPGAASLGVLIWLSPYTLHDVERFTHLSGGAFIGALVGAGYLYGLLLTPLGGIPEFLLQVSGKSFEHYSPAWIWNCVDAIGVQKEEAAAVFGKMAAEVTLCENLLAGVTLAALLNAPRVDWCPTLAWLVLLALNVAMRMVVFVKRLERVAKHLNIRISSD